MLEILFLQRTIETEIEKKRLRRPVPLLMLTQTVGHRR